MGGGAAELTETGKRLLLESQATGRQGAELLRQAADLDGAEACALAAVLSVVGAYPDQGWPQGL